MARSSRAPLVVIAAALLFTGGIALFIGGSQLLEVWRYGRQGVQTHGIVTGKTLQRATAESDTAYELSYRFQASDGRTVDRTEDVPVHLWEGVERGALLPVVYLAGQPGSARAAADSNGATVGSVVALLIGGALTLLGLVFLGMMVRRRASEDARDSTAVADKIVVLHEPSFWPLARRSAGFWFGGFVSVVGVPFLVTALVLAYGEWQFSRNAISVPGLVLTKEIERSGKGNRTKHYEATYRFTADGRTFEDRTELAYDGWARLVEREPADVLFLPWRPSSSRLAGPRPWFVRTLVLLAGSIFALIGATVFVRSVRSARLEWHLRQHGVSVQGTVTDLHSRNLKVDDVQIWRLQYEYSDFQGRRHVKTADVPADEAARWKVGDVGTVLYDSGQPAEAAWLGREDEEGKAEEQSLDRTTR